MLHLARQADVEDHIKMVGKPLKELKRAIRVQKNEPELFAALNTAVKSFVGSPAYQRIYLKWYGKPQPFWTVRAPRVRPCYPVPRTMSYSGPLPCSYWYSTWRRCLRPHWRST